MTQDEIIRMAWEAGLNIPDRRNDLWMPQLERFAALVAAHERDKWEQALPIAMDAMMLQEREACAEEAESAASDDNKYDIAAAIRARNK